jgi:putative phosphoribosyl transferase
MTSQSSPTMHGGRRREMAVEQALTIPVGGVELNADLRAPRAELPLVVFAHGSGSSRGSPRNRYVAEQLADVGLGTVLFDLLTPEEGLYDETSGRLRFDISLLAERMIGVTDWLGAQHSMQWPVAYFGASTGAAAALIAAAERPDRVTAVVSRGGRPDLAGDRLPLVRAPTLLIVGGNDPVVIDMNRSAQAQMRATNELTIVSGATHLFEEPGALEQVAELARDWFLAHSAA